MHEKVTQGSPRAGMAQSHVLVLDALLKLRQVCCDPRLVKLRRPPLAAASSKLDDLLEMVTEMIAEGPAYSVVLAVHLDARSDEAGAEATRASRFVELRGDTADRAEPVRRFEAGRCRCS